MDLVLVMKQRLRDQNSEVRALTRTFLYVSLTATALLLYAIYAYTHTASAYTTWVMLVALAGAYVLMITALHLLQKNRFVLAPFHSTIHGPPAGVASPSSASAFAHLWPVTPIAYPYLFYGLMLFTVTVVVLQGSFFMLVCALGSQLAVYLQYAFLMWRTMSR
jgi:hypothetical protein